MPAAGEAAGGSGQALFVYLHNLQASPENLPRSLLKSVISILTRGRIDHFAATPLYRLVMTFLAESVDFDRRPDYPFRQRVALVHLFLSIFSSVFFPRCPL